ncbi:MAG: helix-turn-helix domain-containing protein [Candidatus Sulfotelmatobacter sp.]
MPRQGRSSKDRLHSVESAAEFLGGVSSSTIRAWLTQGRLTRVKIGRLTRVRESELLTMIHTQEIVPADVRPGKGRPTTAAPTPKKEVK